MKTSAGQAPAATAAAAPPRYAGLARRLACYLLDVCVIYVLTAALGAVKGLTGWSWPVAYGHWKLLFVVLLCGYKALATHQWRTTLGKWVLGVSVVRAESAQPAGLPRLLLREFIGYPLSSILFGIGYWTAIGRPQKQAWSDRISETVEVLDHPARARQWAWGAVTAIAGLGILALGGHAEQQRRARQAWARQFEARANQTEGVRLRIAALRAQAPASVAAFQRNMAAMRPLCDQWSADLETAADSIDRARAQGLLEGRDRALFGALRRAALLRRTSAAILAQEADVVTGYNPADESWAQVQGQLRVLDSELAAVNARARAATATKATPR